MTAPGKFGAGVATRQVGRWQFELLEPLEFNDKDLGLRVVPAGFVSDLASVRILREIARWSAVSAITAALWSNVLLVVALLAVVLYAIVVGYNMRASILHDWEYRQAVLSRQQADDLYWRAQRTGDGTARWRAALFYVGVRVGGRWSYGK